MSRKRRHSRQSTGLTSNLQITKSRVELYSQIKPHVDNLFQQPHIIRRIFHYSRPYDIYQFGLVCRNWHEEAIQFLRKCPPIDDCYLDGKAMTFELAALRKKRHKVLETNLFRRMSWENWFFWRGSTFKLSVDPNPRRYLKNFFDKDMRCIPSFSFIILGRFRDAISSILPRNPTVVINLCRYSNLRVTNGSELEIYEALDEYFKTPELFESLPHDKMSAERYIEGFHLNRYTSNHRVIVTNWSDPKSQRPVRNDPNFPIKSMVLLTNTSFTMDGKTGIAAYKSVFANFMLGSSFDVSGGILCHDSDFLYHDSEFEGLRPSNGISIAFLGRDIKSAWLKVGDREFSRKSVKLKACDFKKELEESQCFPVDDGRVLGFYYEGRAESHDKYLGTESFAFTTISKIFPSIKLFRIQLRFSHNFLLGRNGTTFLEPLRIQFIRI